MEYRNIKLFDEDLISSYEKQIIKDMAKEIISKMSEEDFLKLFSVQIESNRGFSYDQTEIEVKLIM